jgi:hypothetical protein
LGEVLSGTMLIRWKQSNDYLVTIEILGSKPSECLPSPSLKIVRKAEEVGIRPEDILALLDSGCTVRDLLVLVAAKRKGIGQ